jgi:hypothetical protein
MTEKRQFRLNILSVAVGILIPIFASAIPFFIPKIFPDQAIQFKVSGPIGIFPIQAVDINVINKGAKPAKNVLVMLRSNSSKLLSGKSSKQIDPTKRIEVEAKVPLKVKITGDYYVLELGDLRPQESLSVTVVSREGVLSIYASELSVHGIEVKSDDSVGMLDDNSFTENFVYRSGFWMFLALMVFIFADALYREYFMNPKAREKMILEEIEKLDK